MAKEQSASAVEKSKLKEEQKRLKDEEKKQKKDIKKRAKEIAKKQAQLEDEEDPKGFSTFFVTLIIVLVWLAIVALVIKLDVLGLGSEVMAPLLKDVPVLNMILPNDSVTENDDENAYGGYRSLKEAVDYINVLELELEHAQAVNSTNAEEIDELVKEVERLREFEKMQVEFQRIKEQFYEEIIYSDEGPGAEGYKEYYESIDPTTAEALYKQVIKQLEEDKEIQEYAAAYAAMKPKQAAAIFESMKNDLNLVARILEVMDTDTRGKILGVMDSDVAASITKIMNPEG
ncbi:MAG: hypothetical protein J6U37_06475 [Lachnospiraceae bacterium]|nr:hypothetical protein [Lachnospiraceae bacterium]